MKFTYRSGQRPLAGFTIKRGVGQGGFGEVYFAVSDGGKEVALKLLHRHSDAELRGVAHCLNLKHPHLVHLYDLQSDDRGDKWVVMEYVFGESLAQWINRYPTGLTPDIVREWFGALARGVAYLHDHGVVHRDLKPANIFIEQGHLKIGDYGLSRRISASMGGEMTRKIGTPYYMAPEIKNGIYTQSIDVYACGVILYEMLTGHPPFEGQTTEEVLIKHQTDDPDLTKVPAVFAPVLRKALEKNPANRYPNMREFLRAVEAIPCGQPAEPGRASVVTGGSVPAPPAAPNPDNTPMPQRAIPVGNTRPRLASGPIPQGFRDRLTDLAGAAALIPVIAALCTAPWALIPSAGQWSLLGRIFLLSTALSWVVLIFARPIGEPGRSNWGRRFRQLLAGAGVGVLAFWLDGWVIPPGNSPPETSRDLVLGKWARLGPEILKVGMGYIFYFGLATALCPWWRMVDRRRKEKFRFSGVLLAGFWAGVLVFLWPVDTSYALAIAPPVIAAVAVQVASPWIAPPPPPPRPTRVAGRCQRQRVRV